MSDHCIVGITDGLLVLVTLKALSLRDFNSSSTGFIVRWWSSPRRLSPHETPLPLLCFRHLWWFTGEVYNI